MFPYKLLIVLFLFLPLSANAATGLSGLITGLHGKCIQKKFTATFKDGFEFTFSTFHLKEGHASKKAIMILPPIGGKNPIDVSFANYFCESGYASYILETWSGWDEIALDYDVHNRIIRRGTRAIEAMMAQIKEERVGLLATSAGGILLNVAMGEILFQKVSAYFNVVSGYSYCEIVANAGETRLKNLRNERMEKFNIATREEYQHQVCAAADWPMPEKLPRHIRFGMLQSSVDITVPAEYQRRLSDLWKPEIFIVSDKPHVRTVVDSYWSYGETILKFFNERI